MDIEFKSSKFRKLANSHKNLVRKYGPNMADLIGRRLGQLYAADNLDELPKIGKGRCHALKADRAGVLSMDLVHPQRLIFEPANDPVPLREDGGLDWSRVTIVRILEVADTHG